MKIKTHLFAYGSLRPSEDPPKTMSRPERDYIDGDEIQHENRPEHHWAEVTFKGPQHMIPGWTMLIDHDELASLDKREAPQYRRVKVQTENGHDAWTYEYDPNPPKANMPGWNIRSLTKS
jgi:gamma-glutamylcyclotransferase (GGCT)/AIG2-like uncharacterized protein YtfP